MDGRIDTIVPLCELTAIVAGDMVRLSDESKITQRDDTRIVRGLATSRGGVAEGVG